MTEQRKQFEQIYADAGQAFIDKDLDAVDRLTAPDFTADDGKVKKNREEFMEGIKNQFASMDVVSWDRTIVSLKHHGDLIIVVTGGDFIAKKPDGSEVRMNLVNEDAWEKQDGQWKIKWARALA